MGFKMSGCAHGTGVQGSGWKMSGYALGTGFSGYVDFKLKASSSFAIYIMKVGGTRCLSDIALATADPYRVRVRRN